MNSWTNGPVTLRLCDEDDWPLLYASLQDVQGRYWLQTTVEPLRCALQRQPVGVGVR